LAGSSSLTKSLSSASADPADSAGRYSTSEVAELVGLKATQVRHYVRRDLLVPRRGLRGEFRFSFQDVVMLRSAKELLDADVPVRRANRVLLDLKARNAEASRPLSSMRVQAEGTRVVVQEGNNAWDAESGQGSLPFLFDDPVSTEDAPTPSKIATFSILGPDSVSGPAADTASNPGHDPATDPQDSIAADSGEGLGGFEDFATHVETESGASAGYPDPQQRDRQRRDAALKLLETLRLSGLTAAENSFSKTSSTSDVASVPTPAADDPDSGQKAGQQPLGPVPEVGQLTSDDWYNLALDLEEADPDKAPPAYRQALSLNPQNTDAQVNLGRLCQLQGNLKQARRHYKLALGHAPDHQLANYNMGTIYDELDEFATAREFYVRADEIPDAHYNLARIFEVQGDELAALRHMKEYRRLLDADITGR